MIRIIGLMPARYEAHHGREIDDDALNARNNALRCIQQLKLIGQWRAKAPAPANA